MKAFFHILAGCWILCGGTVFPVFHPYADSNAVESGLVKVVDVTDELIEKVVSEHEALRHLLESAKPTIGVPYQWGGTRLLKGIDCSNYTWQLFRSVGMPYERFLSTMTMSRLRRSNGLRKIAFQDAKAGDLLVYGYRDESKKWHGHVVILIDKEGRTTGHKGLVLGAHGGSVGGVQFVTYEGFEDGYFKDPTMRLCNVLRVDSVK